MEILYDDDIEEEEKYLAKLKANKESGSDENEEKTVWKKSKLSKVVEVFFSFVDVDKNEKVTKEEFSKLLTILCDDMGIENLTNEENELLFNTLDEDKSGTLEFWEVRDWVKQLFHNIVKEE